MKKIISMLLALSLVLTSLCAFASFSDVDKNALAWASDAIDYLAGKKIIQGYEDGSFKPYANVTRAEFSKMLALSFDLDAKGKSFADTENHWANEFVVASGDAIYTEGKGFCPDEFATRADIAYAVASVLGKSALSNESANAFSDSASVRPEMLENICIAIENGIIRGYEDGTLKPENPVTRAEAAVIIYRALELKNPGISEEVITVPDEKIGTIGDKDILMSDLKFCLELARFENPEATEAEIYEIAKDFFKNFNALYTLAKEYENMSDEQLENQIEESIKLTNDQLLAETGATIEEYFAQVGITREFFKEVMKIQIIQNEIYSTELEIFDPDEKDILKFYNENKEAFRYDGLKAKHILFAADQTMSESEREAAKRRADSIYKEIKSGSDFDTLMNTYSQDPGLESNPDGYIFTKGDMVKEFEDAAYSLEVGQVSKPVQSDFGYHIIKLVAKLEYLPADDAFVIQYVEQMLLEQNLNNKISTTADSLNIVWN